MPRSQSNVLVHLVFSTKHRNPSILSPEEMHAYLATVMHNQGCAPIQIGGAEDHVHILASLSRTATIAQVVEKAVTSSSKWIGAAFAWQSGYGAFSVGSAEAERILCGPHSGLCPGL